jgi:hypothetical protein
MIVPITYKWGVMLVHLTRRNDKWHGQIKRGLGYSFVVKDFKNIAQAARWARGENGGSK